ncbi:CIS tube protein [Mucilaginibacter phyllosphaerae]|uniref:LysM peptidoglycan-binding domain-containing protein n=1 Tax=Mucilaginibacter phyllosphaerae TaxID=1812349 RepID=A0A4Y8ABT9_9SPHI|nr:LysM peptidoglycan-binding domain-containing protein [Mucilaginibacter phyllosphaerae]MBB3969167.1 hypothetical protein [Mucilaginibacter phyllosphaerae]TEW66024.1 LysM peptidoglycan-binding domain-containing protein [Mucilaginibacter phyllosphaerae]GGH06751.1 hypothetical protein GCM10007352_11100 [Mucilaginibacter phyllosphaerae]
MALISLNKLEKLKIKVYRTEERNGMPFDTFEAMFNPESYSLSYENVYSKEQGINSSGNVARYSLTKPSEISLKLILDGTGVSDYAVMVKKADLDVSKRVKRFMELTAYMDGNIHQPKFLKVEWGTLIFKCRLQSVDITYTLFDKGGRPLRAELSTVFVGDLEEKERLKKENKSSPDLTHKRIVKTHDTLPLLCKEIYGSETYYLQVARANKLNNFRDLTPGQELYFPPVKN